jgi:antitoxin VapB
VKEFLGDKVNSFSCLRSKEIAMLATAKVFTNGNSQAIRLPKAFRVDVDEMWIARNEVTGEITLKPKDTETLRKHRLDELMAAVAENPLPDDFLSDASRQNNPPKNPFK